MYMYIFLLFSEKKTRASILILGMKFWNFIEFDNFLRDKLAIFFPLFFLDNCVLCMWGKKPRVKKFGFKTSHKQCEPGLSECTAASRGPVVSEAAVITCGAQDGISVADTAILAVPEQLLYELVLDFIYLFIF